MPVKQHTQDIYEHDKPIGLILGYLCDFCIVTHRWPSGLRRQTQGDYPSITGNSGYRKIAWVQIPLCAHFLRLKEFEFQCLFYLNFAFLATNFFKIKETNVILYITYNHFCPFC